MAQTPVIKDYFDQELQVNDHVVFCVRNVFQLGKVIKVNPKTVSVVGYDYARTKWRTGEVQPSYKSGRECLKVDEPMVTMFLLKRGNHA